MNINGNMINNENNDYTSQYNNMLTSMGMPQNKLNGIISNLNNLISCDSDCQKRKHADELKRKWDKAEQSSENVKEAEKEYYVFTKGEDGYLNMLRNKYRNDATEYKNKNKKIHDDLVKTYDDLNNLYLSLNKSTKDVEDLFNIRSRENNELEKSIDEMKSSVETNERKIDYLTKNYNYFDLFKKYILILFYILVFVLFLMKPIDLKNKYELSKFLIFIGTLLLLPFLIEYFSKIIF